MSNKPFISIEVDTTRLDQELAAAASQIETAAEQAGEQAARVLAPSIAGETPVRTGVLRRSERVYTEGPYRVMFEATALYASFVNYGTSRQTANPFVERGVARMTGQVEAIYEQIFQDVIGGIGGT